MSIATFSTLPNPYTIGFKTYPISSAAYTSTCYTDPHYSMCKFPKCDSVASTSSMTKVMTCPTRQLIVLKSMQPI